MITIQDLVVASGGVVDETGYVSLDQYIATESPAITGCKVDTCRKSIAAKDAIIVHGGWVCSQCFVTKALKGFETVQDYIAWIDEQKSKEEKND